jgi:hypothetical protein
MPQLIRPNSVSVVTQDGECTVHIVLDLNITVNSDGKVGLSLDKSSEKVEEKDPWVIPTFSSTKKVNFGQKGE